jgi:hypothetical protein
VDIRPADPESIEEAPHAGGQNYLDLTGEPPSAVEDHSDYQQEARERVGGGQNEQKPQLLVPQEAGGEHRQREQQALEATAGQEIKVRDLEDEGGVEEAEGSYQEHRQLPLHPQGRLKTPTQEDHRQGRADQPSLRKEKT